MSTLKKMVNAAIGVVDAAINVLELLTKVTQGLHDSLSSFVNNLKME